MGKRNLGTCYQTNSGSWTCIIQKKLGGKYGQKKRIQRRGATKEEAQQRALAAMAEWEDSSLKVESVQTSSDRSENSNECIDLIYRQFDIKDRFDKLQPFHYCAADCFGVLVILYMETYIKPTVGEVTYALYTRTMKAYFCSHNIASIRMNQLSTSRFVDYYNEMMTKKSLKTMSTVRGICTQYLDELVKRGLIPYNYAKKAETYMDLSLAEEYNAYYDKIYNERKKGFSDEDISNIYYAYEHDYGEYAMVSVFLIETGLKPIEFACLPLKAINYKKKKIYYRVDYVREIFTCENYGKDKEVSRYLQRPADMKNREITLSDYGLEVCRQLQERTEQKCKNNKYNLLFPSFHTGRPRTCQTMDAGFVLLCEKLGIDRDVRQLKGGYKKGLTLSDLSTVNVIAPKTEISRERKYDASYVFEAIYRMNHNERKLLFSLLKQMISEVDRDAQE